MDYGKGWGDPTKYGVAEGWDFVGPDRTTKQHFFLRCKECGGQQSFVKYQLGKPHSCWDCWYMETLLHKPHLWARLSYLISAFTLNNGRTEIEELECLYSLPDPR
ncbi:MAG: hypothetical protein WCC04_03705 [Terriglobales bacterium]